MSKPDEKLKDRRKSRLSKGGSAIASSSKTPQMRYFPTYRLESQRPINREQCENIMIKVVERALEDFEYSPKKAQQMAKYLSEEIKTRIKMNNYDRFKVICIVTIGEKFMQGYHAVSGFLWDELTDGVLNYVYDTPEFFATATVYYLYYT